MLDFKQEHWINQFLGSLAKKRNWLDAMCIYIFFPLKLTFKRIITPGQSNDFDFELVDIFVVYLDFYKLTESRNWCFCPTGGGWQHAMFGSSWLCPAVACRPCHAPPQKAHTLLPTPSLKQQS